MPENLQGRVVIAWLALAVCAFVALRAPLLSLPLERDEGEYAYIAWRMQDGGVPYLDAFDQKPPGSFAAYWLAFTLFGRDAKTPRLLLHLWSAATAWLLFLLVQRLAGRLAAAGAVLVFAALAADPRIGGATANTEAFLLLPLVAALLCAVRGWQDGGLAAWLAAGALCTVAVAFKQVAATNALYVCLLAWVVPGPDGTVQRGGRALALAAGAVAVAVPLLGALAAAGALDAFVDATWLHNLAYTRRRTPAESLAALRYTLGEQAPSFAAAWALAGLAVLRPGLAGRRRDGWLLAGWWVASAAGVAVGLQFRPHYFVQAVPALAALAGVGLAALARLAAARAPRAALAGAVLAGGLLVALPALANRAVLAADSPRAAARALWGLNPFPEALDLARYVARTSAPDEAVFVIGSEPQIFFYAERPSATRYIFFYPLTGGYPNARERQREVMAEVAAARPRYVIWVHVPTSLLISERTDPWVFEESARLLAERYGLELVVHPDAAGEDYVFAHGRNALAWVGEQDEQLNAIPWIAVYRRTR